MKKTACILSLCSLTFLTCVEEIDFNLPSDTGEIVVDALISTARDTNFLKIYYTANIGKRAFIPIEDAQVVLRDLDGNSQTYVYSNLPKKQYYFLVPQEINIEAGKSYFLDITTPEGEQIRSEVETIIPVPTIDSLSYFGSIENVPLDEVRTVEQKLFNLIVHTHQPVDGSNIHLNWQVDHAYLAPEKICSPIAPPKTCYIQPPINENQILTRSSDALQALSSISQQVVRLEMDQAFGLAAAFNVRQQSLTNTAAKYWEDVGTILNDAGSIFEAPPAVVRGNLSSLTDPDKQILGLFSAVDEVSKLAFISRGLLGNDFLEKPICGLPGLPEFDLPWECCACTQFEYSSLIPPPYWPE